MEVGTLYQNSRETTETTTSSDNAPENSLVVSALPAAGEAALADDCDARFPGVFLFTIARANRSWRLSFFRVFEAFEEPRETKRDHR